MELFSNKIINNGIQSSKNLLLTQNKFSFPLIYSQFRNSNSNIVFTKTCNSSSIQHQVYKQNGHRNSYWNIKKTILLGGIIATIGALWKSKEEIFAESNQANKKDTNQLNFVGSSEDPHIIEAINKLGIKSLNLEQNKYKIQIERSKRQIIIRLDSGDQIDRMLIIRDQPDRTIFNGDKLSHTSLTENDTRHILLKLGLIQRLKDDYTSEIKTFQDKKYPAFEADITIPGEYLHVIGYRRRCQLYTLITMVPSIFDKKLFDKEKIVSESIFKKIDFQEGELLKEPVCFDILRNEKRYIEMAMMAELGNGIKRDFNIAIHYWEKVLEKKDLSAEQELIDELFFGLKNRDDFFDFVKLRIQKLKDLNDKINGDDELLPPVAAQFLKNVQKMRSNN